MFIDGGVDDAKLSEWQSRRAKDLVKVNRVVDSLQKGDEPPNSAWMPPPNVSKAVGGAFAQLGCDVFYTAGEADRELASYCATRGCIAVLAKDSDFFVLPVPCYLNLDTLQLHASPPTVTAYRRADVERVLALPSPLLPLLGSLVGNDFVPTDLLSNFHRALLPGRHAAGAVLIDAVARHVAAATGAAGWRGPHPSTPLLWAALDWEGRLSAAARALVERSLEQYAIGEEGSSELPAALVERAATVSTAMLRRFRRGKLDSAVFTSATRQAIWRGPSIDDPDAHPTILASRPIRCETYAACIRASTCRGPRVRGEDPCAASTNDECKVDATDRDVDGMCVTEHIIYSAQSAAGTPESVPVPPQLMSCEAMWALPSVKRCACMLHALGRAFRNDVTVAAFDAASLVALGPVALTLLGVRFLRRHRLIPRVPALVVLAQGLVMGWLAETRQRLPSELRKRPRRHHTAGADSLRAAHLASLYTRVTTDLVGFNSACGEPLALRGPWEWFDGVLMEAMLFAAAHASASAQADLGPSGCWASLLRGDARLLRLLSILRPLALSIEGEADEIKGAGNQASSDKQMADGSVEDKEDGILANAVAAWREATAA